MGRPTPDLPDIAVKPFRDLTVEELHDLLRLRCDVFIVEQQCSYPDIDGNDPRSLHLLGRHEGELVAYGRWYREGDRTVLGRIVTSPRGRGKGWGRFVMERALEAIGGGEVEANAQAHLTGFYGEFGFEPLGSPVMEDGIPHILMVRRHLL